ncbi:MAG: YidC/Oxa1 family membrane protein insertase [Lachnospiraceae bacterium]|nr:YidC/Oxa1 family membrane protein insertase [Lachnospiraceae bacterium]
MYYLTAYNGQILGPIARLLGAIMNAIYEFLTGTCGITNGSIALSIVIFTLFIYICLFPLTYRQQKFSVLTRKMQPEMKAIQKKYKGKKDQASMQAMQEETQALYDKYGTNPTGSCVQMAIQMPILFALYRVFYNVPAYLNGVKDIFTPLVKDIQQVDGYEKIMTSIYENANIRALQVDFSEDAAKNAGYIVDVLYKLSEDGWNYVVESFSKAVDSGSQIFTDIDQVRSTLSQINYIGPINISDTPWNMVTTNFDNHAYGAMVIALLIPLLSYGSQVLNLRLMPQSGGGDDQMAQQMRTMNMMMPLMSLFFTFVTPAGLGIYWIAGALVRTVQQFFLNKHFDKIDLDEIIEKNKEKAVQKAEKRGIRRSQITSAATISTKSFSEKAKVDSGDADVIEKANAIRENARPGTMGAKANLVKRFNESGGK